MATFPTTSGAICAIHHDRVANATCERCGNFVCDECSLNRSSSTCPACRALTGGVAGFPFTRDNWSFDGVWSYCWESFKREWVLLSVSLLILLVAGGIIGSVTSSVSTPIFQSSIVGGVIVYVLMQLVTYVVQGVLQMGMYRMAIDVLMGGKADIARLGSQINKIGRYLVVMIIIFATLVIPMMIYFGILAGVVISLDPGGASFTNIESFANLENKELLVGVLSVGMLIIIVPLLYFTLPLYFAGLELVYNDEVSPVQAIKNCFLIAKGFRLSIFGFAFLIGLLAIGGVVACCVGIIPAMALGQLLLAALYLALRTGSGVPLATTR